jgi:energy-coupling factor transporter ATP-binding protein EcfA2
MKITFLSRRLVGVLVLNFKEATKEEIFTLLSIMKGRTYYYDEKNSVIYEVCKVRERGNERCAIAVQKFNEDPTIYLIDENQFKEDEKKVLEKIKGAEGIANFEFVDRDDPEGLIERLNSKPNFFFTKTMRRIERILRKRVVINDKTSMKILKAFVVYTWIPEISDYATYILVSGDKGSGKSRLLEALSFLCRRSYLTGNTSIALFARVIDKHGCTFFLDEMKVKAKETSKEEEQDIWSILRNGSVRGMFYSRLSEGGTEILNFNVFGPKVLATNYGIPEDIEDRCLRIEMFRLSGFTPKEPKKKDLEMANRELTLLRLWFVKNFEKVKKVYEANKKNLERKRYDGRFIEIISNILPFSSLTSGEIKEEQEKRYEEMLNSEAASVYEVLRDMLANQGITLDKLDKEVYLDFETAVKLWLAKESGMSIEDVESKLWAKDKIRYTTRFALLLKNNLHLETVRRSKRENDQIVKTREIKIIPNKFLQAASRFEDKITVDTVDSVVTLFSYKEEIPPKRKSKNLKIWPEIENFLRDFFEGYTSYMEKRVSTVSTLSTNWILEINDKDLTLLEIKILQMAKENGGLDYFKLREYFKDYSDEDFKKILLSVSKLIDKNLLQLTGDKNGMWIKVNQGG